MQSEAYSVQSSGVEAGKSFIPGVAIEAGFSSRYRYWSGRSGKKYLFTRIAASEVSDFTPAVVLSARFGQITGVTADSSPSDPVAPPKNASLYIHLLAKSDAERTAIVDDLGPVVG